MNVDNLERLADLLRVANEAKVIGHELDVDDLNDLADFLDINDVVVQRWISVEERLPESFRIVLCSDGERVFQAIYETGSKYFHDHWGEVICLDKNGGSTKHMHEPPTHWMPLPEPPKEE